ncbi:MAG: glycosyltransferase [Anaerolineales bacterium]
MAEPHRPSATEFAGEPARGLVSIILPTYNEQETIVDRIQSILEAVSDPVEIIVVDDDSPDRTWSIVEELDDPRIKVIRRKGTRGLATAINRGIIESSGELVGWMDADMSMPADRLPVMIEMADQYPVVIGSRYVDGGIDDRPQFRVVTSRMINGLARAILGGGIKDFDSGFIILRREVFDQATLLPIGYGAYFIDFLHTCRKKGVNVLEIPYALVDRTRGSSKSMPNLWQFGLNGLGYVMTIFFARLRRHG